jgi:hypothetical protein
MKIRSRKWADFHYVLFAFYIMQTKVAQMQTQVGCAKRMIAV